MSPTPEQITACWLDTTTRTLAKHRWVAPGPVPTSHPWCSCGWAADHRLLEPNYVTQHRAHVAVELRTALVAARIPEPCRECGATGRTRMNAVISDQRQDFTPRCSACGGVGTIPGEELLVAMKMEEYGRQAVTDQVLYVKREAT